jgi:sodium-dependent phosphate cotransporter
LEFQLSFNTQEHIIKTITIIITVYLFLLSIKLLGHSFKLFGKEFAEALIVMTSNPFAGLIIGIIATSLIQSSSTTTSIVVGLVAGGAINLGNAIPIVMGANIGTTITNALVSIGHIGKRLEFKKAFAAAVVHDFFNVFSVIVLFPLELKFHLIEKSALTLEQVFTNAGGLKIFNPLKVITNPIIEIIDGIIRYLPLAHIMLMIFSLVLLFASLFFLVKTIRSLVLDKLEFVINKFLFRNNLLGFFLGILLTFIVQSSSVTTSLIIPLAGAGLISLQKIFPYTLGANIGTTGTAIFAALATQDPVAVTVAFAHFCFNIYGILIFYPLKFIPIGLAEFVSEKATTSKKNLVSFIAIFFMLYFIPVLFLFFN